MPAAFLSVAAVAAAAASLLSFTSVVLAVTSAAKSKPSYRAWQILLAA
jgi:hypothetical protein